MAGIQASGLGSGIDISSLVTKLVSAEISPASTRLDRREANLQAQLSAVGTFKGALSDLQGSLSKLKDISTFQGVKATSGDENLFTASAASTAQPGSYNIQVKNLAQAHKMASGRFDDIASGGLATAKVSTSDLSFDFNNDGQVDVQVDAANTTLTGIRDAINNKANLGVRANIVNDGSGYRLTFSATETGEAKKLNIAVSGSDVPDPLQVSEASGDADTNLHTTVPAQDAEVNIDGLPITSASNTITDAIDGVTLNLKAAKEGTTTSTSLTVAKDTAAITSAVQSLVDAYNKFSGMVSSLTSYNATTGQKGALLGDAQARSITSQVRSALGAQVGDSTSTLHTLSEIGVTFQKDGKLALDKSKLEKALQADPQAVADLFAGTNGIAAKLDKQLDTMLKSGGPLSSRTDALNKQIKGIGDQREILSRRTDDLEKRYRAQFTAMDKLVSQLTATGNYLTQQLANLPGFGGE